MKCYLSTVALALGVALSGAAYAQDTQGAAKKALSAAEKKQQVRMRDCTERAGGRKGRERQEFMARCLKAAPAKSGISAKMTEQQSRIARCNRQASAKGMKGDARERFVSNCLKR